ncbi:MAG: dienelactone hydrolase family protein [Actinobacteria bacterium]|nr:MAG: dienelactone hydrolase family protein [Actinomycetota bacterium]
MALYEAIPDEPRAAVIVIQEAYGVNDYIQRVARDLAGAGYHAVAPNLFHRGDVDTVPYGDMQKAVEMIATLTDASELADVDASIRHLRDAGFDERTIGIVGFCMGGRVTFLACARRPIGAGVGFYGGAIVSGWPPMFEPLIGESSALKAPWLGLFGDTDPSIPVEHVEQLRVALADAPVATEIVRYPDAGHGFHSDPRPQSYVPEAAADGWRRTLDWFARHL